MLIADPAPLTDRLMADEKLPFAVTFVTNEHPQSPNVVARYKAPSSREEADVQPLGFAWPRNVVSLSHVALAFPPDDPLYGQGPPPNRELVVSRGPGVHRRAGLLRLPAEWLLRQRFNPFYPYLETRVLQWFHDVGSAAAGQGLSEERSMTALESFSPVARSLIVAAAAAIVVISVEAAAPIIAPVLLAAFIAVIASSPLRWMQRRGVPKLIALGLIVFVLLDVGSIIALIATGALEGVAGQPAGLSGAVDPSQRAVWGLVGAPSASRMPTTATTDILDPAAATALVRAALANVGNVFASGLLILLAVVFMLLEASGMLAKLRVAFRLDAAAEDRLTRLFDSLNQYMRIKILTSLGTAVCIWIWLWFLGIDFAVLWAVLAFFLNSFPSSVPF